jgi:hypothetical protein
MTAICYAKFHLRESLSPFVSRYAATTAAKSKAKRHEDRFFASLRMTKSGINQRFLRIGITCLLLERFDFEKVQALSLPARATRREERRGFLEKPRFFQK